MYRPWHTIYWCTSANSVSATCCGLCLPALCALVHVSDSLCVCEYVNVIVCLLPAVHVIVCVSVGVCVWKGESIQVFASYLSTFLDLLICYYAQRSDWQLCNAARLCWENGVLSPHLVCLCTHIYSSTVCVELNLLCFSNSNLELKCMEVVGSGLNIVKNISEKTCKMVYLPEGGGWKYTHIHLYDAERWTD